MRGRVNHHMDPLFYGAFTAHCSTGAGPFSLGGHDSLRPLLFTYITYPNRNDLTCCVLLVRDCRLVDRSAVGTCDSSHFFLSGPSAGHIWAMIFDAAGATRQLVSAPDIQKVNRFQGCTVSTQDMVSHCY